MSRRLIFIGLSLSSSWGNGHAVTYRALLRALAARGHDILFLERERPWYAAHRDLAAPDYCRLVLYDRIDELRGFEAELRRAEAVIVGSYTPDGVEVGRLVRRLRDGVLAFFDIDTPVTLRSLERGQCDYLAPAQIASYDLYLSFTGGPTLDCLMQRYGAPAAVALHCTADPEAYRPCAVQKRWDLTYLGTYSADRQPSLERLLIAPARARPDLRFAVAGPQYPSDIAWPANVERIDHLAPAEHAAFYAASRYTLNVTREDMAAAGHSPSVRLFEAAACATAILSDRWSGLDESFAPDAEVLLVDDKEDVLSRLAQPAAHALAIGAAARARFLAQHTPAHRAATFERAIAQAQAKVARHGAA